MTKKASTLSPGKISHSAIYIPAATMTSWRRVMRVMAPKAKLDVPSIDLRKANMRYTAIPIKQTIRLRYALLRTKSPNDCPTETKDASDISIHSFLK